MCVKWLVGDERGFTLTEMMVTVALLSIATTGLYAAIHGLLRDSTDQMQMAAAQQDVRPAVLSMQTQLRQAEAPNAAAGGQAVEFMDWNKLVFYSDRMPADGDGRPEQYTYELLGTCGSGGTCQLQLSVREADAASVPPDLTYTGPLTAQRIILDDVVAAPAVPLFVGQTWNGAALDTITSCDRLGAAGPPVSCAFSLLAIDLAVNDNPGDDSAVFRVEQQVRLRNAES